MSAGTANAATINVLLKLQDKLTPKFLRAQRNVKGGGKAMQRSMDGVNSSIKRVLVSLGGFMLVRKGFKETIGAAASFETQMSEVSTLIDGTDTNIRKLGDSLLRIGEIYGQEPKALSKGLYDAVSAGVANASNSIEFMGDASKLAVAGVTDVATSVDLLTTVLNSYGRTAEDAEDVSDTLFRTVKLGKTTIPELAFSMGQVATGAAQSNVSLEEVGAALAAITASGVQTDKAMISLNTVFTAVARATDETRAVAADLGFDFSITALKAKGLKNFMVELGKAVGDDRMLMERLLGNVRAVRGALILAADDGAKMTHMMEQMGLRTGSTNAAYEKMRKTVGNTWARMRATITRIGIQIGNVVLPLLAKKVQEWADRMRRHFGENNEAIKESFSSMIITIIDFGEKTVSVINRVLPIFAAFARVMTLKLAPLALKIGILTTAIAGWIELMTKAAQSGGQKIADIFGLEASPERLQGLADAAEDTRKAGQALVGLTKDGVKGALGLGEGTKEARRMKIELAAMNREIDEIGQGGSALKRSLVNPLLAAAQAAAKAHHALDDFNNFENKLKSALKRGLGPMEDFFKAQIELQNEIELSGLGDTYAAEMLQIEQESDSARVAIAKLKRTMGEAFPPGGEAILKGLVTQLQKLRGADVQKRKSEEQQAFMVDLEHELAMTVAIGDRRRKMLAIQHEMNGLRKEAAKIEDPAVRQAAMFKIFQLEQAQIEGIAQKSTDAVGDAIRNIGPSMAASLSNILTDGIETGFKNAQDIAKQFFLSIAQQIQTALIAKGLAQAFPAIFPAATGGVFQTGGGVVIPAKGMRAMASGGITSGPEVVLRGEAGPEAVVPLPDGRSIPVKMKGSGGGSPTFNMPITISGQQGGDFMSLSVDEQARIVASHVEREFRQNASMRRTATQQIREGL